MADISHVIDWHAAMEQCGDDEDFLRELLHDLRGEIEQQMSKMSTLLHVSPIDLLQIRSAAHVIKGATANLMCEPLRAAAEAMEKACMSGQVDRLFDLYGNLQLAVDSYLKAIASIGI